VAKKTLVSVKEKLWAAAAKSISIWVLQAAKRMHNLQLSLSPMTMIMMIMPRMMMIIRRRRRRRRRRATAARFGQST
jgi:hypothetical protein